MDPFGYLSQPVYQSAGIAGLGLCWLALRRYRMASAFFGISALWLVLCATPAFAQWMQRDLEAGYPTKDASTYPSANAIVILGGGELPHFDEDASIATTRDTRTGFGLALFRASKAPRMLLSGGEDEALQMARLLEQQGVPSTALLTESTSMNTRQNALYCTPLLRQWKLQRILLVTSPLHMRRAAGSFEKQGFTVIPAPTADHDDPSTIANTWLPNPATLRHTRRCLREYFGWWFYRLRGWA